MDSKEINSFGGASLEENAFNTILKILPRGKTILELGSGYTTRRLVQEGYVVHSIEHDEEYLDLYHNNYIYAPLEYFKPIVRFKHIDSDNTPRNLWYDVNAVREGVKDLDYDLFIIDGPPTFYNRVGLLKRLHLFNLDVPILIDDYNRDSQIVIDMSHRLKKPYMVHGAENKMKKLYATFNYPRREL